MTYNIQKEPIPFTISITEAHVLVRDAKLGELSDRIALDLLKRKPTPLEAQAALVVAWDTVLLNSRLTFIREECPTDQEVSQPSV